MNDFIVTYRQEIQSALHDRDQAQKHMRELQDCVGKVLKEPLAAHSNMDSTLRNRMLDVSRHDRWVYSPLLALAGTCHLLAVVCITPSLSIIVKLQLAVVLSSKLDVCGRQTCTASESPLIFAPAVCLLRLSSYLCIDVREILFKISLKIFSLQCSLFISIFPYKKFEINKTKLMICTLHLQERKAYYSVSHYLCAMTNLTDL